MRRTEGGQKINSIRKQGTRDWNKHTPTKALYFTQDGRMPSGLKPRAKLWPSRPATSLWNEKELRGRMSLKSQTERWMSHPCGSVSVLRFRPCVPGHSYLSIQPGNATHLIYTPSQFSEQPYRTGILNPVCNEKQRLQNLKTAEQNLTIWLSDSKAGALSCLSTKGNSSQPGSH